jgi:hypothetical protein
MSGAAASVYSLALKRPEDIKLERQKNIRILHHSVINTGKR